MALTEELKRALDSISRYDPKTYIPEPPKIPDGLVIARYEHGGGRVYFERNGSRDLVMDLYDDDPEGGRREAIIAAVLAAGVLK